MLIAARAAPLTRHIGLVPTVVVTHTEPFHISKAIATLDYASNGRAGVAGPGIGQPAGGRAFRAARLPRTRPEDRDDPAVQELTAALFDEAADYVEVIRRLWDSWDDDAEIRDTATGRFVDRDRLHYIDFAGDYFSVKGPSITPRPPQGQPIVSALGHATVPYQLIAKAADVGFVTPATPRTRGRIVAEIRAAQATPRPGAASSRTSWSSSARPQPRRPTARRAWTSSRAAPTRATRPSSPARPRSWRTCCMDWRQAGLSGFRLRPGAIPDDLEAITRGLVPELQRRGAFRTVVRGRDAARAARLAPPGQPVCTGWEQLTMTKQVHLAAHFPGVNNTTVWSDPKSGSHIEFSSFEHLAQTAERAKFDFLFLAEGLRLREQNGQIYDLDVVGRPDTFTVLAALAAVTDRLGLAGTINSTFNEPYEVARQFASLDHLSGGRAAWNVVTSWDAFTGENFRRGGFLPQEARYERARAFLPDRLGALRLLARRRDRRGQGGRCVPRRRRRRAVRARRRVLRHRGRFNVPRSPQGRPVIFQAGDSEEGREFAAASADAIFSRHGTLAEGRPFYADVKGRLAKYGRTPDQLLILPAATFVLGDTDADAAELARVVRRQQVSGQTAIEFLEQLWNRDLSGYDPDGPLPEIDPDLGEHTIARGRASVRMYRDPMATAAQWRAKAQAEKLSIRDLIIEVTGRQTFIGSPGTVAGAINDLVQADASDGFILVPHITPGGLG